MLRQFRLPTVGRAGTNVRHNARTRSSLFDSHPPYGASHPQVRTVDVKFMSPIIEIENVNMTFQINARQLTVFEDLSYKIPERSFLSVIGPSGCGKSTLLRLISGLERPTKGNIIFNGREIDG